MSNQDKIEWLKRYRVMDQEMKQLTEELERWRARATKITPTISGEQGSGGSDRLQTSVDKICELEDNICRKIDSLTQMRGEIERAINSIPDSTLRQLMRYRYIDGRTFEEISVLMNYSWRWIHQLHSKALSQLCIEVHTHPVI